MPSEHRSNRNDLITRQFRRLQTGCGIARRLRADIASPRSEAQLLKTAIRELSLDRSSLYSGAGLSRDEILPAPDCDVQFVTARQSGNRACERGQPWRCNLDKSPVYNFRRPSATSPEYLHGALASLEASINSTPAGGEGALGPADEVVNGHIL